MEGWSLEVISLNNFAARVLSEETIAGIDQMFVERPEKEEQRDKLTLTTPTLSHWVPEPPLGEANSHENGDSHSS